MIIKIFDNQENKSNQVWIVLTTMSKLDVYYRKLVLTQLFTKGWGAVDSLKK
jgi:hypothetical protein